MEVLPRTNFYFDKSQKLLAFSCGISPVFYMLFFGDPCSYGKSLALSCYHFVSAVFVVVVVVNVQFSFAVLAAIFVLYISF